MLHYSSYQELGILFRYSEMRTRLYSQAHKSPRPIPEAQIPVKKQPPPQLPEADPRSESVVAPGTRPQA
jgi:hypothetical protein